MLELAFIRDNQELVQKSAKSKNIDINISELLKLDDRRSELIGQTEALRHERNQLAAKAKSAKPAISDITAGKELKGKIAELEARLAEIESSLNELLFKVPNIISQDTPLGGEAANQIEKETPKPKLSFKSKDHQTLAEANGWLDFERGAKVAGNKFYYLKGNAVMLELALMRMAMDMLVKEGFLPITTPHMVKSRVAEGTGFAPRGEDEEQEYKIAGEDLRLIATAEVALTGYHADEILEVGELPRLYAGLTPSYRKEAGAYGKHSRGLYRVHQFDKLEMYVLCTPMESEQWHQKLLALEEKIIASLEIPYRVVRIAAGELGAPAYKKYDIEYWSPVDQTYRELTSCSNCTDYQARNLNIKYRTPEGKTALAHTLNGTALAFSRTFIALSDNHQIEAGKVKLPASLIPYMGTEWLA